MNAGDSIFNSILPPSFRFWIFLQLFWFFHSFNFSIQFLEQGHIWVLLRVKVEAENLFVMEAGSTQCLGVLLIDLVTISVIWWQYRLNFVNFLILWWQYRLFWWQYRMFWWQYRWILVTISVIWWQYRLIRWFKFSFWVSFVFLRMFSIVPLNQTCPDWFSASLVLANDSSMPTLWPFLRFLWHVLIFCHFLILKIISYIHNSQQNRCSQ